MTKRTALDGKPYAENPHIRFDEGEVVSAATPRLESLLCKVHMLKVVFVRLAVIFAAMAAISNAEAKQLKVLMIGNSFSVCLLWQFPQCAANAGHTLDLASLFIGGCPLEKHWENIQKYGNVDFKPYSLKYSYASVKKREDSPLYKLGRHTNIPQALKADKWDIVTIQQASPKSPFPETYEPYIGNLISTIRKEAPSAEIVIQQTWSYSPYSKSLSKWNMTPQTMFAAVESAYSGFAQKYNLRIIPTGAAIELFRRRLPVNYGKILTDQEVSAIEKPHLVDFYGDVVGSSEWRKGQWKSNDSDQIKLRIDSIHLNREGHYLQACTWLASLFGYDVTMLDYAPKWIAPDRAALMRSCAAEAVAKYVR